jgi:hypothetical protein
VPGAQWRARARRGASRVAAVKLPVQQCTKVEMRLTYRSANSDLPDNPALSAFSSLEMHRQALESLADMHI